MLWIPLKQVEFHRSKYGISNIRQCAHIGISFNDFRQEGRRAVGALLFLYDKAYWGQKRKQSKPIHADRE